MLDLSTPTARAYYQRMGIVPWALDHRPQPLTPRAYVEQIRARFGACSEEDIHPHIQQARDAEDAG